MLILLFVACTDQEVYLASGTYSGNPGAGALGLLEGGEESVLQDFQMIIDTEAMTATLFPDSDLPDELSLIEYPTEDWQIGCPTPLISVRNQTFGFSADFQIGSIDIEQAIIFASGCVDQAGKNVTEAWLSTEAYQETVDIAGGLTGMLNLVQE